MEEKDFPIPRYLPNGYVKVPYAFVADDAFALKPYLMKLYPKAGLTDDKRIYNYRHSRATENMFGIIANRWRLFHSVIQLPPKKVCLITRASLTLHNILRKSKSKRIYYPAALTDSVGNVKE